MKLIFVRHAQAEGESLPDHDQDFLRELTPKGIKRFQENFPRLTPLLGTVDVIFSSPLYRSVQTAEIVSAYYPEAGLELLSDLHLWQGPEHLVEYISFLPHEGNYLFVGHEPHLSSVVAALLGLHPEQEFMALKKGGVCVLEGSIWEGMLLTFLCSQAHIESV